MTAALPLMKHVPKPLAKRFLLPLGLTATASTTDAAIQKKIFGSDMEALIISNKEMDCIMKIVTSLEESKRLIKCDSETSQNEPKKKLGLIPGMSLDTLAASLLGSALAGKGVIGGGEGVIPAGAGVIRAGQDF